MDSGLRVLIIESDASLAINNIVNFEVLTPDFPVIEDISRLIYGLDSGSYCVISHLTNDTTYTLTRRVLVLDNKRF